MVPTYFASPTENEILLYVSSPFIHENFPFTQHFFMSSYRQSNPQMRLSTENLNSTQNIQPIQNQMGDAIKPDSSRMPRKRDKNPSREKISAKKNSQSNIINHYFNYYMTKQCSYSNIKKMISSLKKKQNIELEKSVACFYSTIRLININRGKNYINKLILMSYFTVEGLEKYLPELLEKMNNSNTFSVDELSKLLRKSFYFYLRDICYISILTSKRISSLSKEVHLQKRRKMQHFLKFKGRLN